SHPRDGCTRLIEVHVLAEDHAIGAVPESFPAMRLVDVVQELHVGADLHMLRLVPERRVALGIPVKPFEDMDDSLATGVDDTGLPENVEVVGGLLECRSRPVKTLPEHRWQG